ncbi:MAG: zinc ABC transporter substrate-binding protein [Roseobacter sp.]
MSRTLHSISIAAFLIGGAAVADVPVVAVDIAPVHSLVARVMKDVGDPLLIVKAGASPHEYSLRPSEAAALQDADLVFWMGEDLTPWMEDDLETLATNASITSLLSAPETELLDFREGALFEAHDHSNEEEHAEEEHGHEEHGHDEHGHDEHDKAEDAHDDHDDHAHEGHDHGAHDPHAWLSPNNAAAWLNLIAAQLSATDPDNAGTYFANAAAARDELTDLRDEINGLLDPVRGRSFIVFHDAYQYFENAFDFPASGAISLGDASDASPARIATIQARVQDEGVLCVLSEPQFNPGLVTTVLNGTDAKTSVVDPLGSTIEPGAELYSQLIRNLAISLSACLSS